MRRLVGRSGVQHNRLKGHGEGQRNCVHGWIAGSERQWQRRLEPDEVFFGRARQVQAGNDGTTTNDRIAGQRLNQRFRQRLGNGSVAKGSERQRVNRLLVPKANVAVPQIGAADGLCSKFGRLGDHKAVVLERDARREHRRQHTLVHQVETHPFAYKNIHTAWCDSASDNRILDGIVNDGQAITDSSSCNCRLQRPSNFTRLDCNYLRSARF
mmetsp:Transcript_1999/g.6311  ORF Transcript_1999/g.6311 Transcript_1999/m.6311 type:complete len:212 (-) Transcript_1999:209-844(-)